MNKDLVKESDPDQDLIWGRLGFCSPLECSFNYTDTWQHFLINPNYKKVLLHNKFEVSFDTPQQCMTRGLLLPLSPFRPTAAVFRSSARNNFALASSLH